MHLVLAVAVKSTKNVVLKLIKVRKEMAKKYKKVINKSICFAYYANGKFIGWYGDRFGSICKTPKLYSNFEKAREVIVKNFSYKMKKINETSFEEEKDKTTNIVSAIGLAIFSGEEQLKLKGKEIELRIVECPIYDGPNPIFDEVEYEKSRHEYTNRMKAEGIFNIPATSIERTKAIKEFEQKNPRPECNDWIYADFHEVKKWAANEPTEFIEIIKPQ